MSTWPVDTVARVTIGERVYECCLWDSYSEEWVDSKEGRFTAQGMRKITDVRPLVVLDLSDQPVEGDVTGRDEPTLLVSMLRETSENFFTPDAAALARKVADQIEAQTRPPKPEYAEGTIVRIKPDEDWGTESFAEWHDGQWVMANGMPFNFSTSHRMVVVEVIREGVTQ